VRQTHNDSAHAPIAVLGAGSWGTALAIQFARAGHPTRLWSRNAADAEAMRAARENLRYLPDAKFPDAIEIHTGLAAAVRDCVAIIIAVPSHGLRALLAQLKPLLARDARLAWATKGFELDTGKLPHQVAYDVLGDRYPVAVLSGPTFAREVGAGLPTAMTIASPDAEFANQLAMSLHAPNFRAYTSTDITGVEVGGAVKNVLAVGAGLCDGLGFGANTRIALITRGLSGWCVSASRSARSRRPSWDSRGSAISCSRARTISRATAASGSRSPRGRPSRRRCARSDRWSRDTAPRARSIWWRGAKTWRCRSSTESTGSCTRTSRRGTS
jgi:hypothetical protein